MRTPPYTHLGARQQICIASITQSKSGWFLQASLSSRVDNVVSNDEECSRLWNPHKVKIGYSHSIMIDDDRMQRESSLIATIRKKLPEFAKACADDTELVLLHQDAFAADYQDDEYMLLGMAIKYAGLRGKEVRVIGMNRSTIEAPTVS
jgi:hypothetical protein